VGGGSRKTAVALVIARLASLWLEDDAARTQVRYAITSLDPGRNRQILWIAGESMITRRPW
jgi:hypothetical protein